MADFNQLKAAVANVIKTNGSEEITGAILQNVLLTIINSISGGYLFGGVAQHSGNVGNPDYNVFYLAGSGSYTGYGGAITIEDGCYGVFRYNGSWTQEVVDIGVRLDGAIVSGEMRGVRGGVIYSTIDELATGIRQTFESIRIVDITPSAYLATKIVEGIRVTANGNVIPISSFQILAATAQKAGLLSAADKVRLDGLLGNIRSLSFADTTSQADQGEKATITMSATVDGITEAISTISLLSATLQKAGLMSAADKAYLNSLPDALDDLEDEITTYFGRLLAMIDYYVCDTAAATADKAVYAAGYRLTTGGCIRIKMTNANTANNVTLNINSTGAKALYYDGAQASATNTWEAGDTLEVYYDGTQYQCASGGGGGKFATGENVKDVGVTDQITDDSDELITSGAIAPLKNYLMGGGGVDVTYNQTICTDGKILRTSGDVTNFSGFKTSDILQIPSGTKYIYTEGLYKNDANTYIGLKFYTSSEGSSVISANVADSGEAIPATIDMSDWPTAKYLRFCTKLSAASVRCYAAAGESGITADLLVQQKGDSEVKAMSQNAVTQELDRLDDRIDGLTVQGTDVTYDDSNSSLANGVLKVGGTVQSMSGYSTSAVLSIPNGTKFLETSGLYKNDSNIYIGLLLYDSQDNILPLVAATGEPIPSKINLASYPTAKKLKWCKISSASAYVKCIAMSDIQVAVLGMVDDEIGNSQEKIMTQKGITDALYEMGEDLSRNEYIALQTDVLKSDSGNWTFGSAWSFSSNGVTPTAVGAANYMRNTKIYYSDRRFMRFTVMMGVDTHLMIVCGYGTSLNAGEGASAFGVDFNTKKVIIYGVPAYGGLSGDTQATSTGYDLTKVVESADIPDAMVGARKYVIELHKHGSLSHLVLMDTKSGHSVTVSHNGWACGRQNQLYGFYCESGTLPTLSDFGVYSENNPDIVFAGDSITEGVYVDDRSLTYPNRYRSSMPSRSCVVSARGGQTINGLMPLFETEWNIYRPKAISLLIGANGGNTAERLQSFKDACDAIGTTLILHYCSCRTGRSMADNNNTLFPAMNLEGARFDYATAIDNTPNADYSNINTSLFGDSVHPNMKGQGEMYNRLKIDCPSMYL